MARKGPISDSGRNCAGGFLERQSDRERRTLPFTFAVNADGAAMQFNQLTDDGQPQPQPAGPPVGLIALAKSLEHKRQKFRRDALAGIAYCNLRLIVLLREDSPDGAAGRRKLNGV